MAGRKMPYLFRRGNTYSFRRGIPARIQHIIGKGTHFVVALKTSDLAEAKRESLRIAAEVQAEFDRAFAQLPGSTTKAATVDKTLDIPGALTVVRDAINLREHRDFVAADRNPDGVARVVDLRRALLAEPADPAEGDLAARLFTGHLLAGGYTGAPDSPAFKVGLAKFRKSLVESLGHAAAWANADFDYLPEDVIRPKPDAARPSMTVTKLAAAYADERGIGGRQRDELFTLIRWFTEVIGGDLDAGDVTGAHIYAFKTLLAQKPSRLQKRADSSLTLPQLIAAYEGNKIARLTQKTVAKHIGNLHAVFGWGRRNWVVKENVVVGMVPPKSKKKVAALPDRLPFTKDDVELIFQAPLFTGVKSATDRHQHVPGDHLVEDHRFWLPILALFTGCRLEEMGQADAADVKQDEGIWYFNVTTLLDDEDYADDGKLKGLKTGTSTRVVPLHPQLIELGFLEYVASAKGGKLFPLLKPDRYGCRTASYSKRFGRWLNRLGITSDLKVFHSFRHLFKDACRIAKIPHEVHQRLTGHAMASVGDKYGLGVPLQDAAEYVAQIKFPTFVPPPKRGAVAGPVDCRTKPVKAEGRRVPRGAKPMPRPRGRSSGGVAASG
ncbi:site-specific integrase [Azospirillum sp. A1-3]|uniref:site-specific integrase n=1 Tax=Azospirillum sp. A1-3 TaxID=185874 RepID=UPI0020772FF4|nr:site-specific integrase [Azospirillum sp. A1-3]MCM8736578.1 site-specific integrase [Azospirillum sp. A1-3]